IYSPPRTAEVRHAEKYVAQFIGGERLLCRDVSFSRGGVQFQGLTAGLPDRTRAREELVRVSAPTRGRQDPSEPAGMYAELKDGSVIFGASSAGKPGAPVFPRRPSILKEPDDLVG